MATSTLRSEGGTVLRRGMVALGWSLAWAGISAAPLGGNGGGGIRFLLFGAELFRLDRAVLLRAAGREAFAAWVLAAALSLGVAFALLAAFSCAFRLPSFRTRGVLFLVLAAFSFLHVNPWIARFLAGLPAHFEVFTLEAGRALAGIAAPAAALGIAGLLTALFPAGPPEPLRRAAGRLNRTAVLWIACAAAILFAAWVRLVPLQGFASVSDELAYLKQGELFLHGRSWEPSPEPRPFFDAEQVVNDGRWYGKYPPGASLCFLPFLAARIPQAAGPFFLALDLLLALLLARTLLDRAAARLAGLLLALSPFVVCMGSSFLSHGPGLAAVLGAVLFHARWIRKGTAPAALGSGACLGLLLLIRPVTALALAVPLLLHGAAARRRGTGRPLLGPGLFSLALAAAAGLLLLYNRALTGDPFTFPYARYAALYAPYDRFGPQNAGQGLVNTVFNLLRLDRWLFGFSLSLLPALALFLWRKDSGWDRFFAGSFLCLAAAYALHWFWGTPWYGPLYYYEAAPFLVFLTARGLAVAGERLRPRAGTVPGILVFAGLLLLCLSVLPFFADRTHHLSDRVHALWEPVLRAKEKDVAPGTWLLLRDRPGCKASYLGAAPSWMTGGIRLLNGEGGDVNALRALHPDRRILTVDALDR